MMLCMPHIDSYAMTCVLPGSYITGLAAAFFLDSYDVSGYFIIKGFLSKNCCCKLFCADRVPTTACSINTPIYRGEWGEVWLHSPVPMPPPAAWEQGKKGVFPLDTTIIVVLAQRAQNDLQQQNTCRRNTLIKETHRW